MSRAGAGSVPWSEEVSSPDMSKYYGNFRTGQTVRIRFNTTSTAGLPTTLSAGAVLVSKDGSDVTPSGGVTLTVDVGSVPGRHHVVIDTSVDPTTFTSGSEYAVRLSGTSNVGGTSQVGIVVGEFSILNRATALDGVVEGTTTLAQSARGWNAALLAKSSGLDVGAPKYRDLADTKNRIDSVSDNLGNRTTVTRDLN